MDFCRLSGFDFDLIGRSILEIVLYHVQTVFGSGGKANLDRKAEGGIVNIVEAGCESRMWRTWSIFPPTTTPTLVVRSPQFLTRSKCQPVRPTVFALASLPIANHAMDSIPQELIDAIIDNVPLPSLPSCSLVAKRWQRRSQQRVFATISFSSEDEVFWYTDIKRDSDRISSYVRHVKINEIYFWHEPALLSRMLGSFSSLTALSIYRTNILDELPGPISRGELGKGITTLNLHYLNYMFSTLTSMILLLPDLKELHIEDCDGVPGGPLPTYSVAPQRGPLDSLELLGRMGGIGEALAKFRFTSRRLTLGMRIAGMEQLLLLSSQTVVELHLYGAWFFSDRTETIMTDLPDAPVQGAPPHIHLPSLPALTTLVIHVHTNRPSPRLTNILFSIGSVPILTSITIKYEHRTLLSHSTLEHLWADVDRWLSRIAKHAKVEGGLPLTLIRWVNWEGFFPEFRESGGRVEVDNGG